MRGSCRLRFCDQHTASQHEFPSRVARNRGCAYSMVPNNTKHAKYMHKTSKYCQIIGFITYLALICVGKVVLSTSILLIHAVFNASSHVLFQSRSSKPRLLADVTPVGYGGAGGKYGIVLPVFTPPGPPTLKDRRATCWGEINGKCE